MANQMASDSAANPADAAVGCLELVEYRIPMPCSVAEYRLGQIYMIAKHCRQQSQTSEGVRVVLNEPYVLPELGPGRYCEKRIYLGSRLAAWINSLLPGEGIFVLEKSCNHFPATKTEYSCSYLPRLSIQVDTKFVDGLTEINNIFNLSPPDLERRRVVNIDIANDPLDPRKYRADEDVTLLTSPTGRLPLPPNWQSGSGPFHCCYKLVRAAFPVWGLQTRVEAYLQDRLIQPLLMHAHRQAAAWMDDWLGLSEDEVRNIESQLFDETNRLVEGETIGSDIADQQQQADAADDDLNSSTQE